MTSIWIVLESLLIQLIEFIWSYLQSNYQDSVQFIANLVTIFGLPFGLWSYWHTVIHENKSDNQSQITMAIKVINCYNHETEPRIQRFNQFYRHKQNKYSRKFNCDWSSNADSDIQKLSFLTKEIKVNQCHIDIVLRDLDSLAIYITNDLCNKALIENTIKTRITKFCNDNQDIILDINKQEHNLDNLINLIKMWRD